MKNNFQNIVDNLQQMQVNAPEEVWTKLDKNLAQKKKRRYIFLLLMFLGLLTFSILYTKKDVFNDQEIVMKKNINKESKRINNQQNSISKENQIKENSNKNIPIKTEENTSNPLISKSEKQAKIATQFTKNNIANHHKKSSKKDVILVKSEEKVLANQTENPTKISEEAVKSNIAETRKTNENLIESNTENESKSEIGSIANIDSVNETNELQTEKSNVENTQKEQNFSLKNIQVAFFYTQYLAQQNLGNQSVAKVIDNNENSANFSRKFGTKVTVNISKNIGLSVGYQFFNYKQKYNNIAIDTINTNTLYGDLNYDNNFGISSETQEFPSVLTQEINYSGLFLGVEYQWFQRQKLSFSSSISASLLTLQSNKYHFENTKFGNQNFANANNLKDATVAFALINKIQYNINDKLSLSVAPELQYFSPTENRNFKPILFGIQFGILWNF